LCISQGTVLFSWIISTRIWSHTQWFISFELLITCLAQWHGPCVHISACLTLLISSTGSYGQVHCHLLKVLSGSDVLTLCCKCHWLWLSNIPMFGAKMSASFTPYIVQIMYYIWTGLWSCDHWKLPCCLWSTDIEHLHEIWVEKQLHVCKRDLENALKVFRKIGQVDKDPMNEKN
jgi:hypothetical protein